MQNCWIILDGLEQFVDKAWIGMKELNYELMYHGCRHCLVAIERGLMFFSKEVVEVSHCQIATEPLFQYRVLLLTLSWK
jgi:hypothetical protein